MSEDLKMINTAHSLPYTVPNSLLKADFFALFFRIQKTLGSMIDQSKTVS